MKDKQSGVKRLYVGLALALGCALALSCVPAVARQLAWLSPPLVLALGLAFALIGGTPYPSFNSRASKTLLQWSVVGLGFGMNLEESLASGISGISFSVVSVFGTLALGYWLGVRVLGIERKTAYLIGAGTAICGGSAIAAVGPTIKADERAMSLALGTVFILNAVALFVFPVIGHQLGMSQSAFGAWAGIAIHDTSSVVGAASIYGEEALRTAILIKLTRALWIIPVALVSAFLFKSKGAKMHIPWFIFCFIIATLLNTYLLGDYPVITTWVTTVARKGLIFAMFFIGASFSREGLRGIGVKPFVLGVLLWLIVSLISLGAVML
ncbi:MAG: putative sulfate exporter family transporter [Porphyromonas sp.]|nr:putative sulfate exporter family transporter [Porphyromonas sp.]